MEVRNGEHEIIRQPDSEFRAQGAMEVSVASVVFKFDGTSICVLAIPGEHGTEVPKHVFQSGMSLTDAARLAVRQKAGIQAQNFYQVGAFANSPDKSESSTVEVGFFHILSPKVSDATSEEVSNGVQWVGLSEVSQFSTSSRLLVEAAVVELRKLARFEEIAFSFLPQEFSLSELQKMFEAIMGRSIDVRNFRKKIDSLGILTESANKPRGMAYRPPRLYSFSTEKFQERLKSDGEIRFF